MMVVKAYISRLYNYAKNNKISNDGYSPVVVFLSVVIVTRYRYQNKYKQNNIEIYNKKIGEKSEIVILQHDH